MTNSKPNRGDTAESISTETVITLAGPDSDKPTAKIIPLSHATSIAPIKLDEFDKRAAELEHSLQSIAEELEQLNQNAKLSLGLIDDNETDITLKVAGIYKELGELDNNYQSISQRLSSVHDEIKLVSDDVLALASLDKPASRSHKLAERATALTHQVENTASLLKQSINENTLALKTLGNLTLTELEIDNINQNLKHTNQKVQSQKAHILSMQSVDAALAKRASALEKTTERLGLQATQLSETIQDLGVRTDALIKTTRQHKGLITSIQNTTHDLSEQLATLSGVETRHFRITSIALLLILVSIVGYSIYDNRHRLNSDQSVMLNNQSIAGNQAAMAKLNKQIEVNQAQQEATALALQTKLVGIGDEIDSVRGQLAAINPFSQFGSDNTIHGPTWLAKLDDQLFVIDLGLFTDKQAMYDAAERYSAYFEKQLAYFPVTTNEGQQLVLVYASFSDGVEAQQVASRLPRISDDQALVQPITAIKPLL